MLEKILKLIQVLRHINRHALPEAFKAKIKSTYFKTFWLPRTKRSNSSVKLMGLETHYCMFQSLEYLFSEIFLNNEYYFVADSKEPNIIDCGSNVGISVLYFKLLYPDSKIIAFEPDLIAFRCLEENVSINKLKNVAIHQTALASHDGEVKFYSDDEHPGSLVMSTNNERHSGDPKTIQAKRLSSFITGEIDFLKMDIEGAELEVVRELVDSGAIMSIKKMVIEYHHHINTSEDYLSELLRLLENSAMGYQVEGVLSRPFESKKYQDILIFAYKKEH